jgi:hypothetical protein
MKTPLLIVAAVVLLVDSTGISAKLDAEEWRDQVGAYLDAASAAVTEIGSDSRGHSFAACAHAREKSLRNFARVPVISPRSATAASVPSNGR